jgi:2-polyprenyl-3-methyl-5-hydroxy-6-metoxy-1,4-benzoquinol methylase
MKTIESCPVCKATTFTHSLNCKDYTVSQETFSVVVCDSCGFKFTNPRPDDSVLGSYYKSEDYISHSDTKKGLVSRLYHLVRNYTLNKKMGLINKYVSRGTILDYGCGTGMFLKTCVNNGWKCYGIEPDADALKLATHNGASVFANKTGLNTFDANFLFDAITLWHVLEHLTDLEETLNFFKAKLNSNGILVIAVPNHNSFDAKFYNEFWAAYDVPRHLYHFDKDTVEMLLSNYGFKLVETKPMNFDSFYVSMLSEKYKTGSINYFTAFMNGLKSNIKAKSAVDYSSVIYVFKKK